jgi:hypothetical protein
MTTSPPEAPKAYTSTANGLDSVAEQLRWSLQRQRSSGVRDFDLAWRLARQNVRLPHDFNDRADWYSFIDSPAHIDWWRRAYFDQDGPADCAAVLAAMIGGQELAHLAVRRRGGTAQSKRHSAAVLG